jgi:hypothetical protein
VVSPASLALGQPPGGGVESVPNVVSLGRSWIFQTLTGAFDPGSRGFRFNNATQSNVTAMYISNIADSGVDAGSALLQLETDDRIYIQSRDDKTKFHLLRVTGPPVDNTTWVTLPVASVDIGTDLDDTDLCTHGFHLGAADAPEMFATVVGTVAELVAALEGDGGDTFIKAGTYPIDLDAVGALNTTPRRFVGAAESEVIITLTGTVPDSLDFTAGLTDLTGVEWANVTFRSLSANVTPALLTGCFSVRNVIADCNALTLTGFSGCRNMTNCTVDINGTASGTGFSVCLRLVNCVVRNSSRSGFSFCTELSNCVVEAIATLDAVVDASAFDRCDRISSCQADYTSTTSAPSNHHGFFSCEQVSACEFLGPTAAAISNLVGFTGCLQIAGCYALNGESGFATCEEVSACKSVGAADYGFTLCLRVSACFAGTSGIAGFESSENLSACLANDNDFGGFDTCLLVAGCQASNSTSGPGFSDCEQVSGCKSSGNAGTGYNNCWRVSASESTGDGSQYASNVAWVSLHSNNFQNIISPAQLVADVDDWSGPLGASVARLDADALGPWTISGIAASPAPHYSRYLRLVNVSANNILIGNQDVGSLAANRIITGTGADITLPPDGVMDLWYDITTARWRVMQA